MHGLRVTENGVKKAIAESRWHRCEVMAGIYEPRFSAKSAKTAVFERTGLKLNLAPNRVRGY